MSEIEVQPSLLYQSNYMSFTKVVRMINVLKKANAYSFKVKIFAQDQQFIANIKQMIQSAKNKGNVARKIRINHDFCTHFKYEPSPSKPCKKIIQLDNVFLVKIFLHQYHLKLALMKKEQQLDYVIQASRIIIYSKQPLSKKFQYQIISMKQKLATLISSNKNICQKIDFSQKIVKQLENKSVLTTFTLKNRLVCHSDCLTNKQLYLVLSKYDYYLPILKFRNQCMFDCDNRLFFLMLIAQIKVYLSRIQENYEIQIQINSRKRALVLHSISSIFSQNPIAEINKILDNFIFITYKSSKALKHLIYIENNKPHHRRALKAISRNNTVFMCWDKSRKVIPQEVARVYRKFLSEINRNTDLKIYFIGTHFCQDHRQKYLTLVHKHRLQCDNIEAVMQKESDVIEVRFKSFLDDKRKEKKNQMSHFLQQLICGRFQEISSEEDKKDDENTLIQPFFEEKPQVSEQIVAQKLEDEKIDNKQENENEIAFEFEQFSQKYPGKVFENRKFRYKEMEELLNTKCGKPVRIWYYLPNPNVLNLQNRLQSAQIFYVAAVDSELKNFSQKHSIPLCKVKENNYYFLVNYNPEKQEWRAYLEMKIYKN